MACVSAGKRKALAMCKRRQAQPPLFLFLRVISKSPDRLTGTWSSPRCSQNASAPTGARRTSGSWSSQHGWQHSGPSAEATHCGCPRRCCASTACCNVKSFPRFWIRWPMLRNSCLVMRSSCRNVSARSTVMADVEIPQRAHCVTLLTSAGGVPHGRLAIDHAGGVLPGLGAAAINGLDPGTRPATGGGFWMPAGRSANTCDGSFAAGVCGAV